MRRRLLQTFGRREAVLYLSVALVTMAVTALALELWRMSPSVPLAYVGDALSTANYLDTIRETGWYESQSRLGAPFGLVYHDYPAADHLHLVIMGLIMAIVPKFGFAMNAYYLIGFPLAALTATWLFRTVGIGRVLSGALAVLFAIAPYHLRRGELHLFLSSYWPIPLFVVLVIRVLRGRGLWNRAEGRSGIGSFVTWQNAGTVAILLVAGSATQYYALFDVLLIGLAALMALVRDRSWRRLVGAIVAGATVAVVLLLNMLPDLLYSAANGPSYGAADRPAVHTEWFALKIALLFMPADTHRFAPFRELAAAYDKEFTQYTLTSVGIVAAIGLIVLLATLTAATLSFARRRSAHDRIDPARNLTAMLGGILLWILVIATSGGLSVFVALLVTTKVRGWDRISIYLVLLGLIAFGLAVQRWLRWLRRRSTGATRTVLTRFGAAIIAAIVLVVGYWDQTSPLIVPPYEQNLAEYTEDAAYASTLQAVLPAGSSVYQLPYQPFPEGPYIVNGMTDYDHVKLALFTDQLSFSYGGVKGRPTADWPIALQTASTKDMVGAVTAAGFAGLSIDRDGYADHGRVLESELSDLLDTDPIVSLDGTYSFWDLSGYRGELADQLGQDGVETLGYDTLHPVIAYGLAPEMTDPVVSSSGQSWRVRVGSATIVLASAADTTRSVRVSFYVANTSGLTELRLELPDGSTKTVTVEPEGMGVALTIEVPPGEARLRILSASTTDTDFAVINLLVSPVD